MTPEILVLAVETSGEAGSAALLRGEAALGVEPLGDGTTRGRSLHPALERLLRGAGAAARDLGLVVVGTGPGSFTGMRVGVAAGRGLAFAAGCPVLGVPSFDALAETAPAAAAAVACARDARRGEAWFALYGPRRAGREREPLVPPCRREAAAAAASLPAGCLVLGSFAAGLAALAAAPGVRAGPPEGDPPAAEALGRIGLARFLRDGAPDPSSVLPLYLQEPLALRRGEGVRGG